MPFDPASVHSLRRVFQQAFIVHDIAEPLVSFDESSSAETLKSFMKSKRYEIVGIRADGQVQGFIELNDLGPGPCGDYMKEFDDNWVVSESLPLHDLILQLRERRRLFVSILGSVGGIVTRSDLQKPPVRMWLFGVVTLIELRLGRLIKNFCGDGQWKEFLSSGRLDKAEQLLQERKRRNQDLNLLDCLQMSDKAQVVARNAELREMTQFESRKQFEKTAKMLEKLRNNLAHSQDIVTNDWEAIVALSENLDRILDGPPGLQDHG